MPVVAGAVQAKLNTGPVKALIEAAEPVAGYLG